MINKGIIEDLNDIKFELTDLESFDITKPVPKKSNHYVINSELYQEFVKYHEEKIQWYAAEKEGHPPVKSQIIGKAILQIARYSANRPAYVRYTNAWKEEMIGKAIERCVMKAHRFDPYRLNAEGKLPSPFSFFTQVCDNAFKEQLKIEKTEVYKKYKIIDRNDSFFAELDENSTQEEFDNYDLVGQDERNQYIHDFERRKEERKLERQNKVRAMKEQSMDIITIGEDEFFGENETE